MNLLNTNLNTFIDNSSDISLAKSLNKSGLVQVQRTVKGKYGMYTRMQWVKMSDTNPGDKIVKVSGYLMKDSEVNERNDVFNKNSQAKEHSIEYRRGTVVEVTLGKNPESTKTVMGVVKSVILTSHSGKSKKEITGTSVQIEDRYGNTCSFNTMNPNCKIKVSSKASAEKFTGRKVFPHLYFPLNKDSAPLSEQQVIEEFNANCDNVGMTFDQFVRENFFDSDGHNETQGYYKKDGKYTPERQKLHNRIIEEIISAASPAPEGQKPIAYLFGGGSASGKSSVVNKEVGSASSSLGIKFGNIDSDKIKESIPEYEYFKQQNLSKGALRVHNESSDIANQAIDRIIEERRCFSFDGTMKNLEKYSKIVDKLKEAGYEVRIASADIPVEEAIKRSALRAKEEGREVPRSIILGSHGGFAVTYPELVKKVDRFCLYDNSQPRGEEPTLIMDQNGVYNQELWEKFLKKGKDYLEYKKSKGGK